MIGGKISDLYEHKNYMTKAYVCMYFLILFIIFIYRVGTILGCPTIALCTLLQNSFSLSISFLFLEYLFAESWSSPEITMILNTISP